MADSALDEDGAPPSRRPSPWPLPWLGAWPGSALARLGAAFAAERERWLLWLPVAWGCGIVLYFELPVEPPLWLGPAVAAAAGPAAIGLYRRQAAPALMVLAAALLAGSLGFALAALRTAQVEAPMLQRQIGPVLVEGTVVAQDALPAGQRIVLEDLTIARLAPADTPHRVRVRLRRSDAPPPTGARVAVLAMLNPPSPPAAPGAYDFRRQAFFEGIGGIGYAMGSVRQLAAEGQGGAGLWLEDLRQRIAARAATHLDGDKAAIAIAMLTGLRGAISDSANEMMRDSGLSHLLSISGVHISLVAMLIFLTARSLLALVEPVALRHPIKKWAAVIGLLGTLLYVLLVGTPAPTLRSFLMTGLILFAILVDRTALSMRVLAWAAVVVMALAPESVLGASFQMSFGAVLALVAVYEELSGRSAGWRAGSGRLMRLVLYVAGVAMTTLVATLATAPFGLYHFQRLATYGSAANLLAVPLTSFWIMPLVLLTYPLLPFGQEELALVPMGWGITAMLWVAEIAAAWPGATLMVPPMPVWGLGMMVLGGLWLCLWRRRWRWGGVVLVLLGLLSLAFGARPDVLVSGDGTLMAVRGAGGDLMLSTDEGDRFVRDIWLRRAGQDEAELWPDSGLSTDGTLSCDALGCLYRRAGVTVALIRDPLALAEDCAAAGIVVTAVRAPRSCRAETVIDRRDLWREGAHAITLRPGGPVIETVAGQVGDRPWSVSRD